MVYAARGVELLLVVGVMVFVSVAGAGRVVVSDWSAEIQHWGVWFGDEPGIWGYAGAVSGVSEVRCDVIHGEQCFLSDVSGVAKVVGGVVELVGGMAGVVDLWAGLVVFEFPVVFVAAGHNQGGGDEVWPMILPFGGLGSPWALMVTQDWCWSDCWGRHL